MTKKHPQSDSKNSKRRAAKLPPDQFVIESNAVLKELKGETDRGGVLLGLAYVDKMLERLFVTKMCEVGSKQLEQLFEHHGPLSTLSGKTSLAYALGWIGPDMYADLNVMRKIRNDFAHKHDVLSFDTQEFVELTSTLRQQMNQKPPIDSAWDRFYLAVTHVIVQVQRLIEQSASTPKGSDPVVELID